MDRGAVLAVLAARHLAMTRSNDFEDGGKPGSGQPGPRETQQGAATPGKGATVQGAAPAAGNVAEQQLDPTPDRVEHPPSSSFTPACSIDVNIKRVWPALPPNSDQSA